MYPCYLEWSIVVHSINPHCLVHWAICRLWITLSSSPTTQLTNRPRGEQSRSMAPRTTYQIIFQGPLYAVLQLANLFPIILGQQNGQFTVISRDDRVGVFRLPLALARKDYQLTSRIPLVASDVTDSWLSTTFRPSCSNSLPNHIEWTGSSGARIIWGYKADMNSLQSRCSPEMGCRHMQDTTSSGKLVETSQQPCF